MSVPTVKLANGNEMPILGFGVWQIESGEQAKNAVKTALEAGYRSIDTAAAYGNEESVGEVVRDSGVSREELFITTKLWNDDQGYEAGLAAFDKSLDRLGLDYVDLYLVHWHKGNELSAETWRAMEKIYDSGRAKAIGVSNYQITHLEELAKTATVAPMVNQVELHPMLPQTELRKYHDEHGIITEAWSPIMHGGELLEHPVVVELAKSHGKTPAQIVLRWHVQQNIVAIPKSATPERIRENLDIFDFELTDEDMARLATLDVGKRIGPNPDHVAF